MASEKKRMMVTERERQLIQELRAVEAYSGEGTVAVMMFTPEDPDTATHVQNMVASALQAEAQSYTGKVMGMTIKVADDLAFRAQQYDWAIGALGRVFGLEENELILRMYGQPTVIQ